MYVCASCWLSTPAPHCLLSVVGLSTTPVPAGPVTSHPLELDMWRITLSLVRDDAGSQRGFTASAAISIDAGEAPIPDMGGFLDAALLAVVDSIQLAFMRESPS